MNKGTPEDISADKQKKYRLGITAFLVATMLIAIAVSTSMTITESQIRVQNELQTCYIRVSDWIQEQRNILSMLCNVTAAKPEMLDDYDRMVQFLSDVKSQYPQIAAIYIANPDFTHGHSMVMDNGWVPDSDYIADERVWYTSAITGNTINITAPYFDERTDEYCITFSRTIRSANGEFYGVMAIDYYLDALASILGKTSSNIEYAFLADRNGMMLDHPNPDYNLSVDIRNLTYNKLFRRSSISAIRDYDGRLKVVASRSEASSGFRVFVVTGWWSAYGNIVKCAILYVALFGVCILMINLIINKLIQWQWHTNESLKEAAESTIRAEKAKTQFLSNISHELRTPINAVLGMNEMILRESKDEQIRNYAMNIQGSGKTLLFLINDILDMSKIESGKMNIVPVNYEPAELFSDLWNVIYLRAQEKGLNISFSVDANLPKVLFGDDVRIKQIVSNILTNAVKYTHKGSVELSVTFSNAGFKMIAVKIAVKDTGIGIKKDDMNKLFRSFQRLEEERNRNIEGAGLGMSITMSLLKQMGGTMQVDSEYQKGSTFVVTIPQRVIDGTPMGDFEAHRTLNQQKQEEEGGHKPFEAPSARVLVVDDNAMNLTVFKALLNRTKIKVDTANSGKNCLELVQKEAYQIIFMDHMMPDMDGIETLQEIKKLSGFPNEKTPVIALTANALGGARDEYIRKGFTDFLTKPIDAEQLERTILQYLPQEIVQYLDPAAEVKQAESTGHSESARYGVSIEQGLHYSTGNMDVYLDLIAMFLKDTERRKMLEQYLAEENMKDYSILVHSLKSNARMLGSQKLADIALDHENESRVGHTDVVKARWDELIEAWTATKEGLAQFYRDQRGEDILPEERVSEDAGDALELTQEQLSAVADLIDNFENDQAIAQLKTWLKSPMPQATYDRVRKALVALEDEFDEGRAMKLLRQE